MNTIICAGGSGAKIVESVLHLCAAGLGPKTLRILAVDPDGSNGNGDRTKKLIDIYQESRRLLGNRQMGEHLNWFGTELDLLDPQNKDELQVWTPVSSGQSLRKVLNFDVLETTETPADVVRLLFTDKELNLTLDQGFRGHPAIGAACMSLLSLQADRDPAWSLLLEKIAADIDLPEGSRVVIAGSVFGGTGASAIHPIARFLRAAVAGGNASRLKIGVAALVPFFRFFAHSATGAAAATPELLAQSDHFSLATRSATEYYQHLRITGDWPFDAMWWVGDSSLSDVPFAVGAAAQQNPAHFVELITAIASLEFFDKPLTDGACWYSGPRSNVTPPASSENLLDWDDIPLRVFDKDALRKSLLAFFISGAAHLGFFAPLLRDPELERRPRCVPWYWERFRKADQSLTTEKNKTGLDLISQFFCEYHFQWWADMIRAQASNIRLFNHEALKSSGRTCEPDLRWIRNYLYPPRSGEATPDDFDAYFTDMARVPKSKGGGSGVAAYCSLLAHAAESYIDREYKMNPGAAAGASA